MLEINNYTLVFDEDIQVLDEMFMSQTKFTSCEQCLEMLPFSL